jgi:integrase
VPKLSKKLTKTVVEAIKEPGDYRDPVLPGFEVRVRVSVSGETTRTYRVNNKLKGGKTVSITIGKHGDRLDTGEILTAEVARDRAERIRAELKKGSNPNEDERDARKAKESERYRKQTIHELTLQRILDGYPKDRRLKDKTALRYKQLTERCLNAWLNVPMSEIAEKMVKDKHTELSKEHPAQANYVMRILGALFEYAIEDYKDPSGNPVISANPVKALKRRWNRIKRRQTAISSHQLAPWYEAVEKLSDPISRDFLLLVGFTGLRFSEAASLEWKNVELEAAERSRSRTRKTMTIICFHSAIS